MIARQIGDVLDLDDCRFDAGPPAAARPRLGADGTVTWRGRAVDVDREGLPTLDAIELPVTSAGADHGRFLLVSTSAVRHPDLERRLVAVTLANQAAGALGSAPAPARSAAAPLTGGPGVHPARRVRLTPAPAVHALQCAPRRRRSRSTASRTRVRGTVLLFTGDGTTTARLSAAGPARVADPHLTDAGAFSATAVGGVLLVRGVRGVAGSGWVAC